MCEKGTSAVARPKPAPVPRPPDAASQDLEDCRPVRESRAAGGAVLNPVSDPGPFGSRTA